MADHDRGAYTPQPDAPLQFDARGPRGRKPMPMTLIGSAAVFVVLLGALALHYRHDSKGGGETARPVGEPIAQIKTAAPASAQPKDGAAGVDVFGGAPSSTSKTPTFAPPPEEAKPRQQLTVEAVEPSGPKTQVSTTAPTTVASAKPAPTPAYHAPTTATAQPAPTRADATSVVAKVASTPPAKPAAIATTTAKTTAKLATAATTVAATKPVKALATAVPTKTAPTKTAPTTAAPVAGSVVQIGAFSSTALSDKGWSDVSAAMTGEMGGKIKRVETVEVNGHTLYRTSVTGFSSRTAADAFCKALAAKGHTCFAKG